MRSLLSPSIIKYFLIAILFFAAGVFFTSNVFAATFTVDSLLDGSDNNPGDGVCNDGTANPQVCTLRAAIEESNALAGGDIIEFAIPGAGPHTIMAAGSYNITTSITIDAATESLDEITPASCGTLDDLSDRSLLVTIDFSNGAYSMEINGAGSAGTEIRGFSMIESAEDNIELDGTANILITCNHLGVDNAGSASFPNQGGGVEINQSSNITIGGGTPSDRNIISGHNLNPYTEAIIIQDSSTINILGNYLGTDITRTGELPNAAEAIEICGPNTCGGGFGVSSDITIGGFNPGDRNYIMFNGKYGVSANGASNVNIINNLISGNDQGALDNTELNDLTIQGNYIGTTEDGLGSLPNVDNPPPQGGLPISILGSQNVLLGGTTPSEGNVISGNNIGGFAAIIVGPVFAPPFTPANNVTIQGNYIGLAADGIAPLPNNLRGISVLGASDVLIGGTNPDEYNTIMNHSVSGISIMNFPLGSSDDITFLGNQLANNNNNAIDFFTDPVGAFNLADWIDLGPNTNDISDSDTGPNDYLNYPVIYDATDNLDGTTTIDFYLDALAGDYRIEFFSNGNTALGDTVPSTLHGEGETFLVACEITHNGTGVQTFNTADLSTVVSNCDLPISSGEIISSTNTEVDDPLGATTLDIYGSTSEFGNTIIVEAIGIDTGDAPDLGTGTATGDYQTGVTDNGAYHLIADNVTTYLGSCVDANPYTLGNTPATGDDDNAETPVAGTCTTAGDDEDGVIMTSPLLNNTPGQTIDIIPTLAGADNPATPVTIENEGALFVWIDFNQNGSFEDPGELVYDSPNDGYITSATTSINIDIPDITVTGPTPFTTYARFRFHTRDINGADFALQSIGEALDGEVEDYQVVIFQPALTSVIEGTVTDTTLTTPIDDIVVHLYLDNGTIPNTYDPSDVLAASQVTSGGGQYSFTNVINGEYHVLALPPTNYQYDTTINPQPAFGSFGGGTFTVNLDLQLVSITPPIINTLSTTSTTPTITGTYDSANVTPVNVTITIDGTIYTNTDPGVTIAGGVWSVDLLATGQTLTQGTTYDIEVDTNNGAGLNASDSTASEITITTPSSGGGGGGSVKYICKDPDATNYDDSNFGRHKQSKCEFPQKVCTDPEAINYDDDQDKIHDQAMCEYEFTTCFQSIDPGCIEAISTTETTPGNPSTTTPFDPDTQCDYFQGFLKKGDQGHEVAKIQDFLNKYMGTNLIVDGDFGRATHRAIKDFQEKHRVDILDPWNLKRSTGVWYKTTQGNANEILGCHVEDRFLEDVNVINKFDNETIFGSFKGFMSNLFQ